MIVSNLCNPSLFLKIPFLNRSPTDIVNQNGTKKKGTNQEQCSSITLFILLEAINHA